jgi:hypothetical protein
MQRGPRVMQICSRSVLHARKCSNDIRLGFDVAGVMGAHALRLVPEKVGDLRIIGTSGALPPCGVRHAQAMQRGSGADQAFPLQIAQIMADGGLHLLFTWPRRTVVAHRDKGGRPTEAGKEGLELGQGREVETILVLPGDEAKAHASEIIGLVLLPARNHDTLSAETAIPGEHERDLYFHRREL